MHCHDAREILEEYGRGELPADVRARVGAHLATCADCQGARDEAAAGAALLRGRPRPPAPAGLRRRIEALARQRPARSWLGGAWIAAAAAAAVVAVVFAPWPELRSDRPEHVLERLLHSGVAEHRRILRQLAPGASEAPDPAALLARVRATTQVPVPAALAGIGNLRLLTARPTWLDERPTAATVFREPALPVATCFVFPGKDLPMPAERRVRIERYRPYLRQFADLHVVYWKQGDLGYLIVSGRDDFQSRQLYLTIRKAL